MRVSRFELGIKSDKGMLLRQWSRDEILKNLLWLRRQNARGADIYIRPDRGAGHDLVLVDDLSEDSVQRMRADGLAPAAVLETSANNFQVWLRLPNAQEPNLRREAARILADRYGGDLASADAVHFSRLAGFTNQKPHRKTEHGQPYVLLHHWSGAAADGGEALLAEVRREIELARPHRVRAALEAKKQRERQFGREGRLEAARAAFLRIRAGIRGDGSESTKDWGAVRALAEMGYTASEAKHALSASPGLTERKRGHIEDYIERTIEKAFRAGERSKRPEPELTVE